MFNFESLTSKKLEIARKILIENGYNDIEEIINSKQLDGYNTTLVVAVRRNENKITLICGEFICEG